MTKLVVKHDPYPDKAPVVSGKFPGAKEFGIRVTQHRLAPGAPWVSLPRISALENEPSENRRPVKMR